VALRIAEFSELVDHQRLNRSAAQHGRELFQRGSSIREVVHNYGAVCQTITELAVQRDFAIAGAEFQTLNLCLDDAIAEAVTEYSDLRQQSAAEEVTERMGVLAHELRSLLNTAMISFDIIKSGRVAIGGSTSLVHSRTLLGLSDLLDLSLADVRLDAKTERRERIPIRDLLKEVDTGALLLADARGLQYVSNPFDEDVVVEGDRQILAAALSNLLQNAFKFTRKRGDVSLKARATTERVFLEVQDECGGLPQGDADDLFRPFEQRGTDRTGVGLGLAICLKAARAMGGDLRVRDLPGQGCVFTLDLPRAA
jgi:signal transduction histidine kinase